MQWLIVTTDQDHSLPFFQIEKEGHNVDVKYYEEPLSLKQQYDAIYFRDPFNKVGHDKIAIDRDLNLIVTSNPSAYFVDEATSFSALLIEDKWLQYELLGKYMPNTELLTHSSQLTNAKIAKKRISARARDIVFSPADLKGDVSEYIVQDMLDIQQEYRVYSVGDTVAPSMTTKSSKTAVSKVKIGDSLAVTPPILEFVQEILQLLPSHDFLGFDVAQTKEGLRLIEVNRSPQFKRYNEEAGVNIAADVIRRVEEKRAQCKGQPLEKS